MRIENIASNVFGKSDLLIVFCLSLRMGDRQRDHPQNGLSMIGMLLQRTIKIELDVM